MFFRTRAGMVMAAAALGGLIGTSAPAAPINMKDVSEFDHFWDFTETPAAEGSALAVFDRYNNTTGAPGSDGVPDFEHGAGSQPTHAGNVLSSTGNFYNRVWPAGVSILNPPNGYTIEYRVRVPVTTGANGVASYDVSSEMTNLPPTAFATAGVRIIVNEETNMQDIYHGAINPTGVIASVPAGEFMNIRIAAEHAPGANAYNIVYSYYVNDELVAADQAFTFTSSAIANRLIFGALGGGFGGRWEMDSLAFTDGAFAPIPEPASLGVLALGAITLLRRQRP